MSTGLALALGRVLGRTNALAEAEAASLEEADATPSQAALHDPWLSESVADSEEDDYGSRATSGTRFRAVQVDDEQDAPKKIRRIG